MDGSLVLDLKHFDPDLAGWEDRAETTTFRLVRVDGATAFFDGLTYHLVDPDTLQVWVALREGDDVTEAGVTLRRRPLSP